MSKFRHLVDRIEVLIGHGPVGPQEVIDTTLDLSTSPNFEKVEEPVVEDEDVKDVKDHVPAPGPKSKKVAEPVSETPVAEAPVDPAPDVEA